MVRGRPVFSVTGVRAWAVARGSYLGKSLVKGFTLQQNLSSGEIGVVIRRPAGNRAASLSSLAPDVAEAHGGDLLRWAKLPHKFATLS